MSLDQNSGIVSQSNAASKDYSYPSAPASGSAGILLIGGWVANPAIGGVDTVTDNRSNTWTERVEKIKASSGGSGAWISIWTAPLVTVTHPVTATAIFNSGNAYTEGAIISWTGEVVFDVKGSNDGASITSGSQPTVTTDSGTASDGAVFVAASSSEDSTPTNNVSWTEPSGYTDIAEHVSQTDTIAFNAAYGTFSGNTAAKTSTYQAHVTQGAGFWAAGNIVMKSSGGADSPLSGQASTGAQTTPTKTLSVAL